MRLYVFHGKRFLNSIYTVVDQSNDMRNCSVADRKGSSRPSDTGATVQNIVHMHYRELI